MRDAFGLVTALVLVGLVGFGASQVTNPQIAGWYASLEKPAWTPPNWLFGPVWSALYVAMAVAAWLVWRRAGFRDGRRALGLFGVQLALNFAWSFIFFGMQAPGPALVEIVLLWLAIVATIAAFWEWSRVAAWLLVPYLVWVSYATALNAAIWWMNRAG